MTLIRSLEARAKDVPKRIGFPEVEEERVLHAIAKIRRKKTAVPVLIGDPAKVTMKNVEIIDITDPELVEKLVRRYEVIRARKKKKVTKRDLERVRKDPIALAMVLLSMGYIDAVLTGASHSTAHTLRNAFQIIGVERNISKASSFFIMDKHVRDFEDIILFADCAVQVNPDSKELAEIAYLTAKTAKLLGMTPRVALLSFSTKGSAMLPESKKVRRAVSIVKQRDRSLKVDGELQFDAALDPDTAKRKGAFNELGGIANVLIFPELESGNIGYKVMRMYGKYDALGPFLQGLKKPVIDLSRSVSVDEIVDIATVVSAIY
ncbi:MAG: phosphate acyltransferase [Candidatus Woesearchaeota archaeon]